MASTKQRGTAWWHGAVVYQIYPRSFFDANGDGIGDLEGIRQKLDYIASLGVDVIWISPFFKSPMKDFGYDVSDYREVDPIFGNMEDFDTLLRAAHDRNLKVIIDQVWSHTSDEHPWFLESRMSRTNSKADWYVWADPAPDGTPPNNWLSFFGGSAWQWEPRRKQYFLHNFLSGQPDLNWHNPEVIDAILEDAEFWLQKGVDGFRLDAANFFTHDVGLRNNPPRLASEPMPDAVTPHNPFARQHHLFNINRPENLDAMQRVREMMNHYPDALTLGEIIVGDDTIKLAAQYIRGTDRLHTAYTYGLLQEDFGLEPITKAVNYMEQQVEGCWPCWAFSNHDVPRVITRWGGAFANDDFAKLLMALKFCLRGVICLYQGDELGLPEATVEFENLRDPYGIAFYPDFLGRDGARTPIPWQSTHRQGGFTEAAPWLPVPEEHKRLAVDIQDQNPNSVLNAYRTFLQWRKQYPVLREGALRVVPAGPQLFAIERYDETTSLLLVFNLTPQPARYHLADSNSITVLEGHGFENTVADNAVMIPGFGAFFAKLGPNPTLSSSTSKETCHG